MIINKYGQRCIRDLRGPVIPVEDTETGRLFWTRALVDDVNQDAPQSHGAALSAVRSIAPTFARAKIVMHRQGVVAHA